MKQLLLLATTSFMALAIQAQPEGMGDNTTAADYAKVLKAPDRATRDLTDLPASWSLKKYTPTPMNQSPYGTCVAWSAGYAARTISYAIQKRMTNKDSINKYAFSPGYLYYKIKNPSDVNCNKGANILQAMEAMSKVGIMLKNEGIADCVGSVSENMESLKALPYKIKDFVSLCQSYENITKNDILKMKKSLTENKPVVVSFKVYNSFFPLKTGLWTPTDNDSFSGGHGMCIVGYNDTLAGGAFEVMNSWGNDWANGGFVWITYQQMKKYGNYAVEMMDVEVIQPVEPVKPAEPVKPKDPPVKPKDPPVKPVEPPVKPVEPPVKPVEPPVKPVEPPVKPVEPEVKLKLSGNMEFIKLDKSIMPVSRAKVNTRSIIVEDDDMADYSLYKFTETYTGGMAFKIKFSTNAPSYIYVFGEDEKDVVSRLFPYNATVSAAINSSNATYYLPSETKHARLSNGYGKENICVLYSKTAIDFEGLMDYISNSNSSIYQGVKDLLGNRVLDIKKVKFEDNKIAFEAPAEDKSVLCFFIELEHN